MDKNEVKLIVESNINQLKKKLGLDLWNIILVYDTITNNCSGYNDVNINYKIAKIVINPAYIKDEAAVLRILLHELVHCLTGTFVTYRQAVTCLISAKEVENAMNVIYDRVNEELTIAFCRILEEQKKEVDNV